MHLQRYYFLFFILFFQASIAAEQLPLEYFTKHNDYYEVQISPDGEFFAVRARQDGQIILAFIDRKSMKVTGGAKPLNDGDIISMRWVNDERLVYTLSRDFGFHDAPLGTGELYAVNRDGSRHELIFGQGVNANSGSKIKSKKATFGDHVITDILRDDKKNILITVYPWKIVGAYAYPNPDALPEVIRLDVYRGHQRSVGHLHIPASRALTDNEGELRFNIGVSKDGDIEIYSRSPKQSEWQPFEMDVGLDGDIIPIAYNQEESSLYVVAQQGENQTDAILRINVENGTKETLFHDPLFDYRSRFSDPKTDIPVYVRSQKGRTEYNYLGAPNTALAKTHRTLVNAFKGQAVTITSVTDDGSELVVFVSSDTNPGEYYLFNTETNKASFIMAGRSWVDPRKMQAMQPISFDTEDGETIHGYLTKPAQKEGPYPTIVLPHGGPHGIRDVWGFDSEAQLFAHHGYAVLQVNYRGSGGYGQRFQDIGYGEWGGKMQDDITAATHWAIKQNIADADRICIYGASYGGYAALMGAVREPELYRCAVGTAGVYDLPLMFDKGDILLIRSGEAYLKEVLGDDREKLTQRSPYHQANKIQSPILLVHGGEDQRVPIEHAKRMKEALEKAGKSVKWKEYSKEGHGIWDEENRLDYYSSLLAFFAKHTTTKNKAETTDTPESL